MKVLVAGSRGQVARALAERAAVHDVTVIAKGRPDLDLCDGPSVTRAVGDVAPDVVVNAAAYTAVDQAETDEAAAHALNADGARRLAAAAAEVGAPIIHLSTDYVFHGETERPWRETDPAAPLNAYGRSKHAGETAVADAHARHVIVRTAWVYSPFGKNFAKTMLRLADNRDEVSVVADQRGAPTSALDIADGLLAMARRLVAAPETTSEAAPETAPETARVGVFHMTGAGEAVWADFAEAIFAASAAAGGPSARVNRIATSDYPTPAKRPANALLDCSKLKEIYGVALPDWRARVDACVRRLIEDDSWRA